MGNHGQVKALIYEINHSQLEARLMK